MEKLIWEYNSVIDGWKTIAGMSIDEDGNLRGNALKTYEFFKSQPDEERGDCSSYYFRLTPQSKIGIGDSTGKKVTILDIDDDVFI